MSWPADGFTGCSAEEAYQLGRDHRAEGGSAGHSRCPFPTGETCWHAYWLGHEDAGAEAVRRLFAPFPWARDGRWEARLR